MAIYMSYSQNTMDITKLGDREKERKTERKTRGLHLNHTHRELWKAMAWGLFAEGGPVVSS